MSKHKPAWIEPIFANPGAKDPRDIDWAITSNVRTVTYESEEFVAVATIGKRAPLSDSTRIQVEMNGKGRWHRQRPLAKAKDVPQDCGLKEQEIIDGLLCDVANQFYINMEAKQ